MVHRTYITYAIHLRFNYIITIIHFFLYIYYYKFFFFKKIGIRVGGGNVTCNDGICTWTTMLNNEYGCHNDLPFEFDI